MLTAETELGQFRVLENLSFADGVLEAGSELTSLYPTEEERKRLAELAGREDWAVPHVVVVWNGRRRLIPQSAIEALDDAAVGTLEMCARPAKPPKPKSRPDPANAVAELKKLGLLVECGEEDCAQLLAELRRGGVSLVVLRGAGGLRILASGPPGTLTARVRGRLQANQRGLLRELGKEPATEAEQRAAAVTDWMERAKYELPEAAE